jgi:hypothetical protein
VYAKDVLLVHIKATFLNDEQSLDLIHLKVCTPMSFASLTHSWYHVTFINNLSHKNWIYFLNTKDEVSNEFTKFMALVEIIKEGRSKYFAWITKESIPS